jgi:hypothetical protein
VKLLNLDEAAATLRVKSPRMSDRVMIGKLAFLPSEIESQASVYGTPFTPYEVLLQSVGGMCHKLCQNPCATKYPAGRVLAQPNFTIQKPLFHRSIEQLCRQ